MAGGGGTAERAQSGHAIVRKRYGTKEYPEAPRPVLAAIAKILPGRCLASGIQVRITIIGTRRVSELASGQELLQFDLRCIESLQPP